jgi:hypothetical protein
MMKNNIIALGLTLLYVGLTVLLASVLYQYDVIKEVLIIMWMFVCMSWIFLKMREIVTSKSSKNQKGVIKRGKEWEV